MTHISEVRDRSYQTDFPPVRNLGDTDLKARAVVYKTIAALALMGSASVVIGAISALTAAAFLVIALAVIHQKNRELENWETKNSLKALETVFRIERNSIDEL